MRQGRTVGRTESERERERLSVKMSDFKVSFALPMCACACVRVCERVCCVCVCVCVCYLYNNRIPITVVPSLCTCGFLDIIVDAVEPETPKNNKKTTGRAVRQKSRNKLSY
jgi:hypothetical protein